VGANNRRSFERAVRLSIGWSFGLAMAMSLALFLAGGTFIDLMTTSESVRAEARAFLVYAALTPVAGSLAFTFDGVYVGATWNGAMRNLMLLALAIFLALWWILQPLGNDGLWIAVLGFLLSRGIGQALGYFRLRRMAFA
jgi:multidrug resistance protein, MATE family